MDSSEDLVGRPMAPATEGKADVDASSSPVELRSLRDVEALAARDALAAKYFPVEWARLATRAGASKGRQKLRQRAEAEQFLEGLRAKGASCANCESFNDNPPFGVKVPAICEAHSDFDGYAATAPGDLCIQWSVAPATTTPPDSTPVTTAQSPADAGRMSDPTSLSE